MPNIETPKKVDYEELKELIYQRHHTRKSLAKGMKFTEQSLGGWLKYGLPMPGEAVMHIKNTLKIDDEKVWHFFYTEMKIR